MGTVVRRKNIPLQRFVEVATKHALSGGTYDDVATELEMSLLNVVGRIGRYRRPPNSIQIPKFVRRTGNYGSKIDSVSANKRIAEMIAAAQGSQESKGSQGNTTI